MFCDTFTCRGGAAAFALAASLLISAGSGASANEKIFNKPKIGGPMNGIMVPMRLGWCWSHQKQCGQRAAGLFCKAFGFSMATNFEKDPNVGLTVSAGDNKVCKQGQCDGFATITCQN